MENASGVASVSLKGSIVVSLVLQGFFFILGGLVLDDGTVGRIVLCAIVAYWIGLLIVVVRRSHRFTPADRLYARWGFLALLIITPFAAMLVEYLRNR